MISVNKLLFIVNPFISNIKNGIMLDRFCSNFNNNGKPDYGEGDSYGKANKL
jgi:hypothetical protein